MIPNKSIIYSRPNCPYCTKIKQVYKEKNWEFQEYVLDEQFTRDQFKRLFGSNSTFPQVVVNNERLGGCIDAIRYFQKNGYFS